MSVQGYAVFVTIALFTIGVILFGGVIGHTTSAFLELYGVGGMLIVATVELRKGGYRRD